MCRVLQSVKKIANKVKNGKFLVTIRDFDLFLPKIKTLILETFMVKIKIDGVCVILSLK